MHRLSVLLLTVLALVACDNDAGDVTSGNKPGRGVLLAEVDGEKIFQQDLDATLIDMFGEYQASMLDEQGRKTALQSLVASKAMSNMAVKQLSRQQMDVIDIKTARYRENIIINSYVKENIVPEPVTAKMVEDYYNNNPEKFGRHSLRQYELLRSETILTDGLRDGLLKAFGKIKTQSTLSIQKALKAQGFDISLHKGLTDNQALAPRLRDFINSQPPNKLSDMYFIDGKAHVVLVTKEIMQPAKPLNEVSRDIRQSLATMQLKKAVKSLSEQALEKAAVKYY